MSLLLLVTVLLCGSAAHVRLSQIIDRGSDLYQAFGINGPGNIVGYGNALATFNGFSIMRVASHSKSARTVEPR